MGYMCILCGKEHADNYRKHWKYKKQITVSKKTGPDMFSIIEDQFESFKKQMEKYYDDIEMIKKTIGLWGYFLVRKHPFWIPDEYYKDWLGEFYIG